MDMRLYAAIVTEESDLPETQLLYGLGKAMKQVERLETMVDDAWRMITTQRQAHPVVNYQCVFIAPEYFFSNRRHMQDRFFSHDVKRAIISRLSALAKRYPSMLIVPGTMLWSKDLHDKKIKLLGRGQSQEIRVINNARINKANTRINNAGPRFGTKTNTQGWSHTRTNETAERKIAQNVAYICMGDKILKYHKVGNYKEVEGEVDDLVFVPGSIVGRFQVGGVKYGIEVCMDHALGVFHSSVPTDGRVHVQIIVSSYVSAKTNTDASVTLHSSTETATTYNESATKATTTGTNPIRFGGDGVGKLARAPLDGGSFKLWVMDLSANDLNNPMNHTVSSAQLNEVAHI